MEKTALDYAKLACGAIMQTCKPEDLPPKGHFHYRQGVFLSGMQETYHLTSDETYAKYSKAWVDAMINKKGEFVFQIPDELDDMQPGILLFELYERTGDKRYKKALDTIASYFRHWKCTEEGGFWHKGTHKNEMWLDGMYMAGPFLAEYGKTYQEPAFFDTVHLQMTLMKQHQRDEKTGLYYHAWDATKSLWWANKETGCSSYFWGRAVGWYAVAMFQIADILPETYEKRQDFITTGVQLLQSLLPYQDARSGLWYQVLDRGAWKDNWPEISCSCLFTYALCMAIRMGCLGETYKAYAQKAYDGIVQTLGYDEQGRLQVQGVCVGTGVCNYDGYVNRPVSTNDLHGIGAFLLMCCEYYQLFQSE